MIGHRIAVELGVKFRSDVSGTINGIRFYKASTNTGTHVGNFWSSAGTLLATATFTNETASGWQQVSFATPVAIKANTVYVVSYHAPVGRYAINEGYFATAYTKDPLRALSNTEAGGNGVYRYDGIPMKWTRIADQAQEIYAGGCGLYRHILPAMHQKLEGRRV